MQVKKGYCMLCVSYPLSDCVIKCEEVSGRGWKGHQCMLLSAARRWQ